MPICVYTCIFYVESSVFALYIFRWIFIWTTICIKIQKFIDSLSTDMLQCIKTMEFFINWKCTAKADKNKISFLRNKTKKASVTKRIFKQIGDVPLKQVKSKLISFKKIKMVFKIALLFLNLAAFIYCCHFSLYEQLCK